MYQGECAGVFDHTYCSPSTMNGSFLLTFKKQVTILQNNSATTQPVLLSSLILDRPALGFKTLNVNMGKSAAVGNVIQGQQKQLCFLLIHTLSTLFDLNVCRSAL